VKPVNLLPGNAPAVAVAGAKPNLGLIGGAAVGIIALVGVAGYFAMARVDSVKSEAAAANTAAQEATTQAGAARSEIASLGQPIVDSDKQLAQGAEQVLVAAYTERHDFVQLSQELRGIMEGTGGWYETVEASSSGGSESEDGKSITIVGYMPTATLAAGFNERVEATKTMKDAEATAVSSERLRDLETKRPGVYFKFTIKANLVDTIAPSADGGDVSTSDSTGGTIGESTGGGALSLSLDPEPAKPKAKAKTATPAKPANPFDLAAAAAGRGGVA
jgi:hypothetical protein